FWNAEIITGPDGRAQVSVPLPDNLTTWQVDLRGLTVDSRTGEAATQVVTGKDLLVRPVTPRFLVAGDHALVAAVVQNNTAQELPVEVSLQASGFQLDDPGKAAQAVRVPANGRVRVEWWGAAQGAASADLIFTARSSAQSGSQPALEDSTRPDSGPLPIYHFTTQQSFATSGVLAEGGQRLELVSLPRSFDPAGGDLKIELAPSLAAAMLRSLDTLDAPAYECTEQSASRLIPTLEVYRAIQQFGLKAPELQDRLDRALIPALQSLLARQNADGGWGSCQGDDSNLYISAYALFGLAQAKQTGLSVSPEAVQRAVDFIKGGLASTNLPKETWQLDRLAFEQFALAQAGAGDANGMASLYPLRDQLDPWAQALLAAGLEGLGQDSQQVKTLLSNLESSAVRSASGAHWELHSSAPDQGFENRVTSLANSAIVVYTLAQYDPGSALLGDAVRFLMANRQADGGWSTTYTTAWTVMALTEAMKGTGELGGSFGFGAALNGAPVASGQAGGAGQINPVTADISIENLYADLPNALLIQRDPGPGRLYYSAALNVNRPVESIPALQNDVSIGRAYFSSGSECPAGDCPAIQSAQAGQRVTVRLSLTLEHDAYDLLVQDFIPAGAEILDTHLLTSQQGPGGAPAAEPQYDPRHPFDQGWGWWYFHEPQIHADRIAWEADTLPAGTYQLTYTLVILQPGQYRVRPAGARQLYFPDVQGSSAGALFEIKP
ncbi:MAG TPA: alpha-2-macroglobulin family protein, partial [Anaerolineales bacterium]